MTPPALVTADSAVPGRGRLPFGGRPAYPRPDRPDTWRLCRTAWPRPGWQDDDSGVPPRCQRCGRSIAPHIRRAMIGSTRSDGALIAWVRGWRHLPIRRRVPIYGEGADARPLPTRPDRTAYDGWAGLAAGRHVIGSGKAVR